MLCAVTAIQISIIISHILTDCKMDFIRIVLENFNGVGGVEFPARLIPSTFFVSSQPQKGFAYFTIIELCNNVELRAASFRVVIQAPM